MYGAFDACLDFTLRPDFDGQPAHLTPGDDGGWTAWGVTFATWLAWNQAHGWPRPTIASFQRLGSAAVVPLYRAWFWDATRSDLWAPGVDLCVFDFGVGSGPVTSLRVLQAAVGVAPDGIVGPITRAAVAEADPSVLIDRLTHRDADFYAACSGAGLFLRGWDRRNDARCAAAHAEAAAWIAGHAAAAADAPTAAV